MYDVHQFTSKAGRMAIPILRLLAARRDTSQANIQRQLGDSTSDDTARWR